MALHIYPYTAEELENNYEFKVVKRIIMKEFPWIKNVVVDSSLLNTYNLIFLNFEIDPIQYAKTYGLELGNIVKKAYENGREYEAMYLSLLTLSPNAYEDTSFITDRIKELAENIRKSPVIPDELKIKGGRVFTIGDWYFNKGATPWHVSDYETKSKT